LRKCIKTLKNILFSFINLSEFYNVKFGGQESAYAFGNLNENQWYYHSATRYANYCFTNGILFSVATIVTFLATIKKHKKLLIIGVCLIGLLFVSNQISMGIQ